jgi:hypothetical protein
MAAPEHAGLSMKLTEEIIAEFQGRADDRTDL